jgi:hypothetical protein
VLVADAGYGEAGGFRQALSERGIHYAVQVAHTVTAYPLDVERSTVAYAVTALTRRRPTGSPHPLSGPCCVRPARPRHDG